ncbi:DUF2090 domain-containing protein [Candidatus Woesearchaeota archaeon]|nr:DUF2090 domain-containing protein [Candidatus Woesearchaeota archaeon]
MELYILPFDHRNSFIKGILGVKARAPNKKEVDKAREFKIIIYEAFKKAVEEGVPKEHAGVLTDDWLGIDVLKQVKKDKYIFCIPVEKSGQKEFKFDHLFWKSYIKRWNPDYVKCLVRYNPENKELNKRQNKRLAKLSKFLKKHNLKLMFELLVPPTEEQSLDKDYDNNIRPNLTKIIVQEIYNSDIHPDIWKIEGFDKTKDMKAVAELITKNDKNSRIIILGRGESKEHAEKWLKAGAKVKQAIGFVIGRTTFLKALEEYNTKKKSRDRVILEISYNFKHFYNIWKKAKSS